MTTLDIEYVQNSQIGAPIGVWSALVEIVRAFRPSIVVLIARKMPRLFEHFKLDFGSDCIVISDMAVPFCHALIAGRKIAVVDDLINRGSTIEHVGRTLIACGAAEIGFFSLGFRETTPTLSRRVESVFQEPLKKSQYESLVASVPDYLRQLNKPYDLEFPVLRCRVLPPAVSAAEIIAWLRESGIGTAVHDLTPCDSPDGLTRITLDLAENPYCNYKIRFYINWRTRECNLLPLAIRQVLQWEVDSSNAGAMQLRLNLCKNLKTAPKEATLWPEEAECRASLFFESLQVGFSILERLAPILAASTPLMSAADIGLLFGPTARNLFSQVDFLLLLSDPVGVGDICSSRTSDQCDTPLWPRIAGQPADHFVALVRSEVGNSTDPADLISAAFDVLGRIVGASSADAYSLEWPYSKTDVLANPYLRLRVGLTFRDLVRLYELILPQHPFFAGPARSAVSIALDQLIDWGAAVPTISNIEGKYYRVYRQGEGKKRNRALARLKYAWSNVGPLSLTRAQKIDAILAFSAKYGGLTVPSAYEHGTVTSFEANCLNAPGARVVEYARNTGQLEIVQG